VDEDSVFAVRSDCACKTKIARRFGRDAACSCHVISNGSATSVDECGAQRLVVRVETVAVEHHPQKERAVLGIGEVLIRLDDVCALPVQKSGDGGDDSRAVCTANEQPAEIGRNHV
jgi:hypothetical protein